MNVASGEPFSPLLSPPSTPPGFFSPQTECPAPDRAQPGTNIRKADTSNYPSQSCRGMKQAIEASIHTVKTYGVQYERALRYELGVFIAAHVRYLRTVRYDTYSKLKRTVP